MNPLFRYRCHGAALACLICLWGCDHQSPSSDSIHLRMAHVYEMRSPTHRYGAGRLAERLQQQDVGLSLTVYPASQLGNEDELLEQLVAGELDLAIAGGSFLAMWYPPVGVFDAIYAFDDLDHMLRVSRSDWMARHWEQLRVRFGILVLDTWPYGTRHITSHRPIRHPDDLRGLRLRLPSTSVWQASGAALGASPMPIPFADVYMALQQRIADGQENPISVIKTMGFHEVQKYLNLTAHHQSNVQVLINERSWQRLTDLQRQTLLRTIRELGREVYDSILQEEEDILRQWKAEGTLQVVEDVDVEAFRQKAEAYFSSGFPFSELFRAIRAQASSGTVEPGSSNRESLNHD